MVFDVQSIDCRSSGAQASLASSLRETGFAVLREHPIPASLIKSVYEGWAGFFASEEKFAYRADPATYAGFFPFRTENAKDALAKDLKEFYHVYPGHPLPAALAADTKALYDGLVELGATLLSWLERNTPAAVASKFSEPLTGMIDGSSQNLLRILHYPPIQQDAEADAVRAAAHEDINLITLLVSGSAPGLEARDSGGTWHAVPCDPGMITVNAGDMLQKASGGYYPSTTHRVVNPEPGLNLSRYSRPMFLHPRPEVRLDENYTADSYLQERLREIGLKR